MGFTLQSVYERALARWPSILWPFEAFSRHCGERIATHPVDHFLGSAAGHRDDGAWNVIHSEIGPTTCAILRRKPTADMEPDELWSESVARLIDDVRGSRILPNGRPMAKIVEYEGHIPIEAYFVTVATHIAITRNRKKKASLGLSEVPGEGEQVAPPGRERDPATEIERHELLERLIRDITDTFDAMTPAERLVIQLIYIQNMPKGLAGTVAGFAAYKVSRILDQFRAEVERRCAIYAGLIDSDVMRSAAFRLNQSIASQFNGPKASESVVPRR